MAEAAPDSLTMWVVYRHPSDYPDSYVVRQWVIPRDGSQPRAEFLPAVVAATLADARLAVPFGLTRLPRYDADDRAIEEVWL